MGKTDRHKKPAFNPSIKWVGYGKIEGAYNQDDGFLRTMLGEKVYWEPKRDGSNISLLFHKHFPLIYTRNQKAIESTEIETKALLKPHMNNLENMLGENHIMYMELMRKGKSPARFEVNEEAEIVAFDIYNTDLGVFLNPNMKYQLMEYYGIPYIKPFQVSEYTSVAKIRGHISTMIDHAKNIGIEGYVVKWMFRDDLLMIKVKVEHKYPKEKKKKRPRIADSREPLEYSEITGAIDKVWREIGDDIRDKSIAMPLIAKAVGEECRKHSKSNPYNLFAAYIEFVEEVIKCHTT